MIDQSKHRLRVVKHRDAPGHTIKGGDMLERDLQINNSVAIPRPSEVKRARLVMNPVSGDTEPNPMKLPDIVSAMEAENIRADIAFTKPDESPALIAKRAVDEGYDMVVVAGGDGTVSEVAKGLIHAPIPLGIIPIGTFNNIARSLDLPTELQAACSVLAEGRIRTIDVGQANDEHYFFEAAGVGLDAALFPLGEEIKGGRWGRLFQAARLTMDYKPARVRIQFDRPVAEARLKPLGKRRLFRHRRLTPGVRAVVVSALLITIANGPYYGTGFTVAPDAQLDDRFLTISVFRDFSKWELMRHFWSISKGQYHYSPKIDSFKASEVRLSSLQHLPVHIDGHPIGELPVTLKTVPHALKVIVPTTATPHYQRQEDPSPPVALPTADEDDDPTGEDDEAISA